MIRMMTSVVSVKGVVKTTAVIAREAEGNEALRGRIALPILDMSAAVETKTLIRSARPQHIISNLELGVRIMRVNDSTMMQRLFFSPFR